MPRLPRRDRTAQTRAALQTPEGSVRDGDVGGRGRGVPSLAPDRCIASGACIRICPTAAISLDPEGAGRFRWRLDFGACTLCGLCIEACEPGAILASGETHLAVLDRADLVAEHLVSAHPPARPPAPGESYRRGAEMGLLLAE